MNRSIMETSKSFLFMILISLTILSVVNGQSEIKDNSRVGNWSVGNCILTSFAMEMTIHPNNSNRNAFSVISVPVTAKVLSDEAETCKNNETQELKLGWIDTAKNGTQLSRNLTISFHLNKTDYGVNRIYGNFVLGEWNTTETQKNQTVNVTVFHQNILSIDTGIIKDNHLYFKTPIRRSYLCANPGNISLTTYLKSHPSDGPPLGEAMKNTTLSATTIRFDAFRGPHTTPKVMQTALDCDYKPNDIVPIGVGIALALLVGFVLTAYLIGRRRVRQRGYQSV